MDKKLNEVTKVTDMAYVPVIMADGSIGQIAKSDLASVVAGVLSTKANTPLLHHEGSLYSAENPFDIDSFYMGIVTLNKSSWSSYPVNEGVAPQEDMRGTLFAYRNDNGSGFFGSQVFTSLDNVAYIRNFWGNTMGSWQRIDNFGYNSLAELAGGVAEQMGAFRTYPLGIITDANDAYSGIFPFNMANTIANTGGNIGLLIHYSGPDERYATQICTIFSSQSTIKIRHRYNDSWSDWSTIQ